MDPQQRRLLDEFLVDNDELAELSDRLGRLNLFGVLRCEHAELRHSNVLAWLLDPQGGHGLGDLFLRRLLARILMEQGHLGATLSAAHVELMPPCVVDVRREWRNCDVLVHNPAAGWCLLIENKIRAGESRGQLQRYTAAVGAEFPGALVIPVFLTLDGGDPSEDGVEAGWISLSYAEVVDVADRLVAQRTNQIPEDAAVLLRHWLETLRRLTMTDPELLELCRAIYRRHRAAIDLIVEYGRASSVMDACAEYVRSLGDQAFEPVHRSRRVWFVPKALAKVQKDVDPGWRFLPETYPIAWWFEHMRRRGRLKLCLEVGPISDGKLRIRLLEKLKAAGFEFREKEALRAEARFTRIWTKTAALPKDADGEPDEDPERISAVANKLWAAGGPEATERVGKALRGFSWK